MSTYSRMTKNPITGVFEKAQWMDDHFGHHHYGVKFPDGSIIDPAVMELEIREQTAEERLPEVEAQLTLSFETIMEVQRRNRELEGILLDVDKAMVGVAAAATKVLNRARP